MASLPQNVLVFESPSQKMRFPRKRWPQRHTAGYHGLSQLLALTSPAMKESTFSKSQVRFALQ